MILLLRKIKKSHFVLLGILSIIFAGNVMSTSFDHNRQRPAIPDQDITKYAGSAVCANCHKDIYDSAIKTAHYLDSRPAAKKFIKGSFKYGSNKFVYSQWMEVKMVQKRDSFFQRAFINGIEYQTEPFNIVIGSGRKGQTYLYWNDNKLFELPVSYYTNLNSWCNSPGFPDNFIKFDRQIPAQCLECHGTYAKAAIDETGETFYDRKQILYGITCERCHGPAAAHVAYQQQHPEDKTAKYIVIIKTLARQQRLDGCALCHSGFRIPKQPAFNFTIGDTLDNYSQVRYNTDSTSTLDVHGNQYGLLTASKCFKMSHQMDCASCHNVHVNEANSPKIFSQRCITCHAQTTHTSFTLPTDKRVVLADNCIDCHMPMLPSHKIVLNVANSENAVPDLVRTHKVAIYLQKTKEYLEKIK
jgi:Cytochrome c554 and c-prime